MVSWGKRARASASSSAREVAAGLDDLVQETHSERFLGSEHATGQDHVEGPAEADDSRQPLRAAVDQGHAEAALREAEGRTARGHAQVAPQGELEPAGQAPARDRRVAGFVGIRRVKPSGPSGSISRGTNDSMALRSAPAQKASSPPPVSTRTRASSSASKRSTARASSSAVGPSTALRRSGRSMVSTAAAPRRS